MTQSDNIVEFLKYASPRLDYIEHCMEKQALSPTRALQAVKAFRARSSKGLLPQGKNYDRIKALSDSVGKLRGKEKNQLKNVAGKLHKKYYDGKYVKGDYNKIGQRSAAQSFVDDYYARYGRLPDQFDAPVVPAAKPNVKPEVNVPIVGNDIPGMPRPGTGEMLMPNVDNSVSNFIPESVNNIRSFDNALQKINGDIPGMPRPGTGEMIMRDAPMREAAARQAFLNGTLNAPSPGYGILRPGAPADAIKEVAEPGMWDNITAWMREHPYLTVGGGVAAGAAGGAGLGYGIGSGSGMQEGSQIAQRYYELREALDRQRLQRANDSFLSRLGNLFGTGDLSGLIG